LIGENAYFFKVPLIRSFFAAHSLNIRLQVVLNM